MPTPLEAAAPDTLKAWVSARRSIRRYRADPLPAGTIERLIDAARFAPSAHNRQPWRFFVLQAAEDKARLADAMGDRLRVDRLADGDDPQAIDKDVANSRARIVAAPAVIAVCFTLADMDRYADARRAEAERLMAVQSTAMAAQNLLLLAHAEGLGACWMCACQATDSASTMACSAKTLMIAESRSWYSWTKLSRTRPPASRCAMSKTSPFITGPPTRTAGACPAGRA